MTRSRTANPQTIHDEVAALRPGTILTLSEGHYLEPIVVASKSGSQEAPIVLQGDQAVIGAQRSYKDYARTANQLSAVQEAGGQFPGVYYLADDAALILRDCQWLVIEDLMFDGCWPTAIYLDNCQHITLRGLDIRGGTFAIGATGPNTRHLLIEDCSWIQDTSGHGEADLAAIRDRGHIDGHAPPKHSLLWSKTDWDDVHRDRLESKRPVNIDTDARAFDGDFFRAWTIAGYVIIRNNVIADAFNAVHFFNLAATSIVSNFSRNVLIENNWFLRIRDNAIEPENYAWNWTIRHNKFVDCYGPFSFEMARSGYFYIYGNLGWNRHKPGPANDQHTTGQLFKFGSEHIADGPHYVFNNSWILRGPVIKKNRFSHFIHVNNAIDYYEEKGKRPPAKSFVFGSDWKEWDDPSATAEEIAKAEGGRFTRLWRALKITFDGDIINHPEFPEQLRNARYAIGEFARREELFFNDMSPGRPEGLKTAEPHSAIRLEAEFPDGQSRFVVETGAAVGAWQSNGVIEIGELAFETYWPTPNVHDRTSRVRSEPKNTTGESA